jgi:hypothetical protein
VQSGRRIVGLRHDLDTVYGLRWGLPRIVAIEKKCGVRSTLFVRVDVVRSDKDKRFLKALAADGWEIGLHLINTVNDSGFLSPEEELKRLKELLDVPIYGVTPCGTTFGFKGDVTWRIMDSLGLKYMEGYGMPEFKVNCFVFPTHLPLDIYYVRNFGEKEGYVRFKEELLRRLESVGLATVLVHPEGFVRSVQGGSLMKISLTLLRKGMMNKVYDKFLCEFQNKVKLKKYIDIC